jgi:hypothetical protein
VISQKHFKYLGITFNDNIIEYFIDFYWGCLSSDGVEYFGMGAVVVQLGGLFA